MKISLKKPDFTICVQDDAGNYITSGYVNEAESMVDKFIPFKFYLKGGRISPEPFTLKLTRNELKVMSELIQEIVTHL